MVYSDNKNRYVLAYLHALVDMSLFDRIEVHFLPKGMLAGGDEYIVSILFYKFHITVSSCFFSFLLPLLQGTHTSMWTNSSAASRCT